MAILLKSKSLTYDDVTLLARPGVVNSRKQIPIEGNRIIVSAMTSIICKPFIEAVSKIEESYQPTLHLPRDSFKGENLQYCYELGLKKVFIGVGLIEDNAYEVSALCMGYDVAFLDIASGYLPQIPNRVKQLKEKGFKVVITGSVHTPEGVDYLENCGVSIIRTGIGTSSQICSTRYQTGFYRGSITEILECSENSTVPILADGGFVNIGDLPKAFLAGADYCMGARLFTKAKEARMHVEGNSIHFGMSNPSLGISNSGFDESFVIKVDNSDLKPLEQIIKEIWDGIRSGISYSGFDSVTNAIGQGTFEVIHK